MSQVTKSQEDAKEATTLDLIPLILHDDLRLCPIVDQKLVYDIEHVEVEINNLIA